MRFETAQRITRWTRRSWLAPSGVVLLMLTLLAPVPAQAGPVIDFATGSAGAGGTITIVDAGTGATGTNILINLMTVIDGSSQTVFDVSGAGTSATDPSDSTALLNFAIGSAGNFITLTGGVPTLLIPDGTILLTGSFATGVTISDMGFFGAVSGSGPDTKDPALLTALGIPVDTSFQFLEFTLGMSGGSAGVFTATSTDILNRAIPEPRSIALLGIGLLALAGVMRRRRRRK